MGRERTGGDGPPVVFWGRMLLLTPVSYGLVFGANFLLVTAVLILFLEPLELPSYWWLLLLMLALGVGLLVGGLYLAKGMWQYYREYIHSQPAIRSARAATTLLVCATAILAVLSLAVDWRAYAVFRRHQNEIKHGAKHCPACGEYAVEHQPGLLARSAPYGLLDLAQLEGDHYECRDCGMAFVMGGRGVLIKSRTPSGLRPPLPVPDAPADQTGEPGTGTGRSQRLGIW